mmetsp:Transcript_23051/g.25416  ORF Transcript_23051/g.25416 Transcript_23051/m.25416 type:complete len:340 (+) Transcript_23051:7-1026(+)
MACEMHVLVLFALISLWINLPFLLRSANYEVVSWAIFKDLNNPDIWDNPTTRPEENATGTSEYDNKGGTRQHRHDSTKTVKVEETIEYLLSDLIISKTPTCGGKKCFFKSKTKPSEIGFLVTSEFSTIQRNNTDKGWELFQKVASQFDINHFQLEEPWHCEGCGKMLKLPQKVLKEPLTELCRSGVERLMDNLVIQKVRTAPPPTTQLSPLWKLDPRDLPVLRTAPWLKFYYKDLNSSSYPDQNVIKERNHTAFFKQLADGLLTSINIIDMFPELAIDFQLYIDHSTGEAYHLDFDRPFDRFKSEKLIQAMRATNTKSIRKVVSELHILMTLAENERMS